MDDDDSYDPMDSGVERGPSNQQIAAAGLYDALATVVRQMEGCHPVGHDAFLAARRALKRADEAGITGSKRLGARGGAADGG